MFQNVCLSFIKKQQQTMPRRSKRIKTATQSGGTFGNLPRSIVVHMLKYFDISEVARLQRFVCREFLCEDQLKEPYY